MRSECLVYADDIKIWRTLTSDADVTILQDDLSRVASWLADHGLQANPTKCACMHIQPGSTVATYTLSGVPVRTTSCERDLGTLTSADLSTTQNTNRLASNARSRIGILVRLTGRLDRQCFPAIFRTVIRPHLEVNIQAACPFLKRDALALEMYSDELPRGS